MIARPAARVVHGGLHRTRLRIDARRGDDLFFERARRTLAQCHGVHEVTANPRTGSLLVLHDADIDAVGAFAAQRDLFEIDRPAPIRITADQIRGLYERLEAGVARWSEERIDLPSLALVGLLAGAAAQMARGRVLPSGGTLVWYAATIAALIGRGETPRQQQEQPEARGLPH